MATLAAMAFLGRLRGLGLQVRQPMMAGFLTAVLKGCTVTGYRRRPSWPGFCRVAGLRSSSRSFRAYLEFEVLTKP